MVLTRVSAATAAIGVLACGGLTSAAPAHQSPPRRSPRIVAGTAAAAPRARLRVSDSSPLQLHGVLFDASASRGDIVTYVFHYGDGVVERTYQPLAMHGYRNTGTYRATVVVIDASGQQATSAGLRIRVRDGIPPVVSIDTPRAGQRMRLGAPGGLLTGSVSDAGDVKRIELAIQLRSSKRHFNTHGLCIWYDAHRWLVLSGCSNPYFFAASVRRGRWRFRISPSAQIPAGSYVVRVRAIDRTGNISHFYSIRLRTILPFELVG